MMPSFWLDDGFYRVRGTSSDGSTTYFDLTSVLALGASSGSGGGGGSVDDTTIFQTGDVMWSDTSGTRSGWVRNNARTIGSASSGASERANSDCQALFLFGWAKGWSVVGGSGATAAADWAANKQITLPDHRGRMPIGLDDMGNSAAGKFSGVPFTSGNATTAGSLGGEATHTLVTSEIPAHDHSFHDPGHTHALHLDSDGAGQISQGGRSFVTGKTATGNTDSATTGITISSVGGDAAHNNTSLFVTGTSYRKL